MEQRVMEAVAPEHHSRAKALRVAVIGCGAIAEQMHFPVIAGSPDMDLVAVIDRDADRAARFAKGYAVPHVLSDASGLTSEMIDAAVVATPPSHHAPCTIDLVKKGIHVLVEKPISTNYADAVRMVEAAEEAGVILSVGHYRRLYPSIQLLKGLIDDGFVGRPLSFQIEGGGNYTWSAATLGNMSKGSAGGGSLIDFGSHLVDLMFALFDGPAEVIEYRDNARGGIEADCEIRARVRHAGEALEGTIDIARTRNAGNFIRVQCERGTLEFQISERFRVKVQPRQGVVHDASRGGPASFTLDAAWTGSNFDEPWFATFGRQLQDWTTAIRTGNAPVLSGRSALRTTKFIDDCYARRAELQEPWVTSSHSARTSRGTKRGRVLVTGASGFIGCRVAEILRLRENLDVRAVVHNPANASRLATLDVEMVQADFASATDLRQLVDGCDSVVHCAVGTDWKPQRVVKVTVDGTKALARAATQAKVNRFVHISTMAVYGVGFGANEILTEDAEVKPVPGSVYGESKTAAERGVLALVQQGLQAVVLRPARVYGPFSKTFVTRPIQAIAQGRFQWLGSPDVPSDVVYVDNVVEAIVSAILGDSSSVVGQAFNVGDGGGPTWRAFYQYFADAEGLDLSRVGVRQPRVQTSSTTTGRAFGMPGRVLQGVGSIMRSREFKALGTRILDTDPVGTFPREMFGRFPSLEGRVRRAVGADDSLPIYRPTTDAVGDVVYMGSVGETLSVEKLRRVLGFAYNVSQEQAMCSTLEWVRHARLTAR